MNRYKYTGYFILSLLVFFTSRIARAVEDYKIGHPTLTDIWVDPVNGADGASRGATRLTAYKTVQKAWANIPSPDMLTNTGYRIMLAPGTYDSDNVPSEFSQVWGTSEFPVIFQAADDTGSVKFPSMDITTCKYFYMIGITVIHSIGSQGGYAIKFRSSDHVLLRNCRFLGADSSSTDTAIAGAVFEQCQNIYLERSEIGYISQTDVKPSGIGFDAFASQYGHIKNCRIHHFGSDGIVLRGGSAYFSVEENFISYGGGSGIQMYVRDTTNGLDNMVAPWIHYDANDVKCFNNVIHHTGGAGFSCSGGFNILFAFNTLYEIGQNSSLMVFSQARRGTSVDRETSQEFLDQGGWGTSYWYTSGQDTDSAPIPNKNIFVYNNVFANPDDSATNQPHLTIAGPFTGAAVNAGGPRPSLADDNLTIKGNVIWNGPSSKAIGINAFSGCQPSNPECNENQLYTDNLINAAKPDFVDTANAIFRPTQTSVILTTATAKTFAIPDFSWIDLPPGAQEPPGNNSNKVTTDIDSNLRTSTIIPGAYIKATSSVAENLPALVTMQAYPNPSYGESAITFHLEHAAHVRLEVFDILGKKVATLASAVFEAGDHIAIWNAAHVDAGSYYCRLNAGGTTMTRQITIIK